MLAIKPNFFPLLTPLGSKPAKHFHSPPDLVAQMFLGRDNGLPLYQHKATANASQLVQLSQFLSTLALLRVLTVDNNGPLAVFAIVFDIISGDSDSASLIVAVFQCPSGQPFRLGPVMRLSTEAKLIPGAICSELAWRAPNTVTATINLRTYLIVRPTFDLGNQQHAAGSIEVSDLDELSHSGSSIQGRTSFFHLRRVCPSGSGGLLVPLADATDLEWLASSGMALLIVSTACAIATPSA